MSFYYRVIGPKEADRIANSVDPDQTAPLHCLPRRLCLKIQDHYDKKNIGRKLLETGMGKQCRPRSDHLYYCSLTRALLPENLTIARNSPIWEERQISNWKLERQNKENIMGQTRAGVYKTLCLLNSLPLTVTVNSHHVLFVKRLLFLFYYFFSRNFQRAITPDK